MVSSTRKRGVRGDLTLGGKRCVRLVLVVQSVLVKSQKWPQPRLEAGEKVREKILEDVGGLGLSEAWHLEKVDDRGNSVR